MIFFILETKKLRLREDRQLAQGHPGSTFGAELPLRLGSPDPQTLPSKGRALLPGKGEQGTQPLLPARVLYPHNPNNLEAAWNPPHNCLCPCTCFKCKRIL